MRAYIAAAVVATLVLAVAGRSIDMTRCVMATFADVPMKPAVAASLSARLMVSATDIAFEAERGNALIMCFGGARGVNATNMLLAYTPMERVTVFGIVSAMRVGDTNAIYAATTMPPTMAGAMTTPAPTAEPSTPAASNAATTPAPPAACATAETQTLIAFATACWSTGSFTASADTCTAKTDGTSVPVQADGAGCADLATWVNNNGLLVCLSAEQTAAANAAQTACTAWTAANSGAASAAVAVAAAVAAVLAVVA